MWPLIFKNFQVFFSSFFFFFFRQKTFFFRNFTKLFFFFSFTHNVYFNFTIQLWRVGTCFIFWGRLSFQFLINMLFLYRYSGSLETTVYEGRTADYVFFLLFSATFMLVRECLCSNVCCCMRLLLCVKVFSNDVNAFCFGNCKSNVLHLVKLIFLFVFRTILFEI